MQVVVLQLVIILVLIVLNGLFAMSEIAVISARKGRLQHWVEEGNRRADTALRMANEPNRFLSTIQVGITLIGIFTGAYGGATLAERFGGYINRIPAVAPYGDAVALGVIVVGITYLTLIFGELVPKRVAMAFPERIAVLTAPPMQVVSRLAAPAVWILSVSTDKILKLFRLTNVEPLPVTEEEIVVMMQQGRMVGAFEKVEEEIVKNVFELGDEQVQALMTPRKRVEWLDIQDSLEENLSTIKSSSHHTLPVCDEDLDNVLGVIRVKDLLLQMSVTSQVDLRMFILPALFMPESMRAYSALKMFKESKNHMALVTDEYGVIQGLITLSDIIEAIVGEMPAPNEVVNPQAVEREDGSWLLDGMLAIDDFKRLFDIKELPTEETGHYQTLGGFIMTQLQRVPAVTDRFEWDGFSLEVMDMDGNRVDKVLLEKSQAQEARPPEQAG